MQLGLSFFSSKTSRFILSIVLGIAIIGGVWYLLSYIRTDLVQFRHVYGFDKFTDQRSLAIPACTKSVHHTKALTLTYGDKVLLGSGLTGKESTSQAQRVFIVLAKEGDTMSFSRFGDLILNGEPAATAFMIPRNMIRLNQPHYPIPPEYVVLGTIDEKTHQGVLRLAALSEIQEQVIALGTQAKCNSIGE